MEAMASLPGAARRSRSSGLLLPGPSRTQTDAQVLEEALGRLSGTTAAITANVRRINAALERILEDKVTVEELEQMLVCQGRGPERTAFTSCCTETNIPEECLRAGVGAPCWGSPSQGTPTYYNEIPGS